MDESKRQRLENPYAQAEYTENDLTDKKCDQKVKNKVLDILIVKFQICSIHSFQETIESEKVRTNH